MVSQPRIGAAHQEWRPRRIRGLGVIRNERNEPLDRRLVIPVGELGASQSPESRSSQVRIGGIVIGSKILIAGRVIIPKEQRFVPAIDSHDGGKGVGVTVGLGVRVGPPGVMVGVCVGAGSAPGRV